MGDLQLQDWLGCMMILAIIGAVGLVMLIWLCCMYMADQVFPSKRKARR